MLRSTPLRQKASLACSILGLHSKTIDISQRLVNSRSDSFFDLQPTFLCSSWAAIGKGRLRQFQDKNHSFSSLLQLNKYQPVEISPTPSALGADRLISQPRQTS